MKSLILVFFLGTILAQSSLAQSFIEMPTLSGAELLSKFLAKENEKVLVQYLERVAQLEQHIQINIKQFDIQLAQDSRPIFEQETYNELLKNKMVHDRLEQQILYVTRALLALEANKNESQSLLATKILTYSRNAWKKSAKENTNSRFLLQDLFFALKEDLAGSTNLPVNYRITQNIVEDMLMDEDDKAAIQKKLQFSLDTFLNPFVSDASDSASIPKEKTLTINTTSAPSLICPSAGPQGTISGDHFPKGVWAITFDDGPHQTYTEAIKKTFEEYKAKVSFFWLAQLTPSFPHIISDMKNLGFSLNTHSYSHANLPTLGEEGLQKEITLANKINANSYGFKPKFFRCPYGACGKSGGRIRQLIADDEQVHVFWNVDSLDWKDKDPDSIVRRVMTQFDSISKRSGGVILMHDIHPQSAAAIAKLLPILLKRGAQLDTIENIVGKNNELTGQSCPNNWSPYAK